MLAPSRPCRRHVVTEEHFLSNRTGHQRDHPGDAAVDGKLHSAVVQPDARPAAEQANQPRGYGVRSLMDGDAPANVP